MKKETSPHVTRLGVLWPGLGEASARKPASPPAAAREPTHSCQLRRLWIQKPKMATRNGSSKVKMGWTTDSVP